MAVPSAPQNLNLEPWDFWDERHSGLVYMQWDAPSSTNGTITRYQIQWATNSGFTANVADDTVLGKHRQYSRYPLLPNTLYYFHVRAENDDGWGAWSSTQSITTPVSTALDNVQGASLAFADGLRVELRSSGASGALPTVTLGYIEAGSSTFTAIATLPSSLAPNGGPRSLALTADAAGNIYVVGRLIDTSSTVAIARYARTGSRTWGAFTLDTQSVTNTGDALRTFAALWVPAAGRILVLMKRVGQQNAGALSWAVINPSAIGTSAPLFQISGNDPSWLSTPPNGSISYNAGTLDLALLSDSRVAILANTSSVIEMSGTGAITGISKGPNYSYAPGQWGRVLPISTAAYIVLGVFEDNNAVTRELEIFHIDASTSQILDSATLPSSDYAGISPRNNEFGKQWDAYYDPVAQLVRVYYVDAAATSSISTFTFSPVTGQVSARSTVGSVSGGTIHEVRVGRNVDERRVLIEVSTLNGSTHGIETLVDTSGNRAPNAPNVVDVSGFDATQPFTFAWTFSDPNVRDTAPAGGTLRIERVSDGVEVFTTALGAVTSFTLPGGTLTNGVSYRWQVRSTDAQGAVGTYSALDTFTATAAGTLTITNPAVDNPAGYELSSVPLTWTFSTSGGYTQAARRVRVLNHATGAVLSDTGTVASSVTSYTVTGLLTDVEQRIEVTVTSTAPGSPSTTATRLITPSYAMPMTPEITLDVGETSITVTVNNPPPTGDRPEVVANIIERREVGSDVAFEALGMTEHNGTYDDFAVASAVAYEYQARGVTDG